MNSRTATGTRLFLALALVCALACACGGGGAAGAAPATQVPTAAPTATPTSYTSALYQLQGYSATAARDIAAQPHQLAVIDLNKDSQRTPFSAQDVQTIRASGKKVLAYFEIGSIENFRTEYPAFKAQDNPPNDRLIYNEWVPDWPGEFWIKYWDDRWWTLVIKPRIDQALASGFDGIYLDTPLAYENIDLTLISPVAGQPPETRATLAQKMVNLIVRISQYAKAQRPGFWVFPQNSPELRAYTGYAGAIDGIGVEDLYFGTDATHPSDMPCTQTWCTENLNNIRALRDAGKIVIAIDYATIPANIATACANYKTEHFTGLVTVRALDTPKPPCP